VDVRATDPEPAGKPRRALLAALVLTASAALAACGSASLGGERPPQTTSVGTSATSRSDAARRAALALLSRLVLPPGAHSVTGEPAGDGGRLARPAETIGDPDLVDVARFDVGAGAPPSVVGWIEAHRPSGSSPAGTGYEGLGAGGEEWSASFSWPPVGQLLDTRTLVVSVTAVAGGMTGIRVDAQVTWLPAKPASDLVPAGATILTAVLSHGLNAWQAGHPLTTTTDAALIAAIRARANALPVAFPGTRSCPADFGQLLTLSFYAETGAKPLATVEVDPAGCQSAEVVEQGHLVSPGLDGSGFASYVETQLAWHLPAAA
jgi:hypothetical protein